MDIHYFRDRLRINKHDLDGELEVHADHLERIGRQVAAAARNRAKVKQNLEAVESRISSRILRDEPRLAANKLEVLFKKEPEWRQAHDEVLDAEQSLSEWEALEKAWYSRGFDLRVLGELFGHQYFSITEIRTGGSRQNEYERQRQEARQSRESGEFSRHVSRRVKLNSD